MPISDPCNPLMVEDLLCDILDFFSPAIPIERRTLVSLAQTCRALSDPSLDRLWREMYSLKPLIRCYTTIEGFDNMTPPNSSQFAIISKYSHRIWELTVSESVSVRFLKCMSMHPSFSFSNLMVLRWGTPYVATSDIPIIFVQRLLSPTLVSLSATLDEAEGATLLSFFDNYPTLCPNLRSIEFRFSAGLRSETSIQTLSRAICSQKHLEKVVIHAPIDSIALRYLSKLPTLKLLSVSLPRRLASLEDVFSPTEALFTSVEELELVIWDLSLVSCLLQRDDQIFHSFRLHHHGRQTSQILLEFLDLLTSTSRKNTLQDLSLSFGDFSHPIPTDQMASEAIRYRLSYKTLYPLTHLSSLRELVIEWSEQISLDDDDLTNLAHSWPLLRVFNVYCGRGGYAPFSTKYASLRGLLLLVNACPELQTVSLPIDARQIPVAKETDVCETNFTCLIVPESPIDEALPVAEFLFKYLPCVTAVDAKFLRPPGTDGPQILAYGQAWQQVEMHLEELHYPLFDSVSSGSDSTSSDSYSEGSESS